MGDGGGISDAKQSIGFCLAQEVNIAGSVGAKAEVIPNQQVLDAKRACQRVLDKVIGALCGLGPIKLE